MTNHSESSRDNRLRRERLEPAKSVIEKFQTTDPDTGRLVPGEYVLARHMKTNVSVILRWMYSSKNEDGGRTPGRGGKIPVNRHADIMRIAGELGVELAQSELYPQLTS